MHYEVETPEPRRTGHRWVDFTIAGSALMVSVISLAVAIGHGRIMEKMADANGRLVKASSWPFMGAHMAVNENAIVLGVANEGVGPAKVRWVQVTYDGKPARSTQDLLAQCCGLTPAGHFNYAFSLLTNTVVRAGDTVDMITLKREPLNDQVFEPLRRNALRVGFRICYCSVFDECFISNGLSLDTRSVNRCVAPADAFRESGGRETSR
ncbi:MAG: hypothetical protein JO111_00760 [Caulobacteraceae bacterium]|nr:hypothetical protein [Caulobacteraceae bacterium]